MNDEKNIAIRAKVGKLVNANFVKEIRLQTWVTNLVLVKKSTNKWKTCVNLRDLRNACPKDCYPLPHIDQHVNVIFEHKLLSFIDAYFIHNHIKMVEKDAPYTTFHTDTDNYH